jgi:serine/threonine protein phosphatase PrpC
VIEDVVLCQLTQEKNDPGELANHIRNWALGLLSLDNISVIVKKLK